jgi:hypothetical protein
MTCTTGNDGNNIYPVSVSDVVLSIQLSQLKGMLDLGSVSRRCRPIADQQVRTSRGPAKGRTNRNVDDFHAIQCLGCIGHTSNNPRNLVDT